MPTVDIVNLKNEKVGSMDLNPEIFAVTIRKHLLTEVVHWQRACRRAGTQSALTKSEVNGTTKKPFPQKGRGMARQGSLKSPHQIGGGVAFAPKPRDYSYAMPKAKRRAALAVALSARVKEGSFKIVQDFDISEPKTKVAVSALKAISAERSLVVDSSNPNLKRSMKNLEKAKFIEEAGLNVYDILHYPVLAMTQRAVTALQERMQ
ncbi:MAG: 50S ribosomal protein L4 [Myxococcota bacterium]